MYYSYLEDFHVEPKSWADFFERNAYRDTDNAVKKVIRDYYAKE